jgi:protoporphyrinogen oxidase
MAFIQMILAGETCAPLSHVSVRSLLGCLCSDSWYRIHGGTERLAKILRAKSRMTLNLRTQVYAVRETGAGVTVRWIKGGRRYQAGFDGAIIAAPEADRLVGRKSRGHFHSYVSVLLQYRRPWWNEENPSLSRGFRTGFYTDGPLNYIQQAFRTPRGRRTLRILLPDAHRKLAWSDGRIRDFCAAALRNISSLAERPAHSRITRWRHGLPCGRRRDRAERVSGRVCLAGDRFGDWPSMNAAIVSGKHAARLVSAELMQARIAPSRGAQRFGVTRPPTT